MANEYAGHDRRRGELTHLSPGRKKPDEMSDRRSVSE